MKTHRQAPDGQVERAQRAGLVRYAVERRWVLSSGYHQVGIDDIVRGEDLLMPDRSSFPMHKTTLRYRSGVSWDPIPLLVTASGAGQVMVRARMLAAGAMRRGSPRRGGGWRGMPLGPMSPPGAFQVELPEGFMPGWSSPARTACPRRCCWTPTVPWIREQRDRPPGVRCPAGSPIQERGHGRRLTGGPHLTHSRFRHLKVERSTRLEGARPRT